MIPYLLAAVGGYLIGNSQDVFEGFAGGGQIKSKKSLFKDLEEIDPVKFKGVNLKSEAISDETFGKESYIFIYFDTPEERMKFQRALKKKGYKVTEDYSDKNTRMEVRVSYFKGWQWDE